MLALLHDQGTFASGACSSRLYAATLITETVTDISCVTSLIRHLRRAVAATGFTGLWDEHVADVLAGGS